MQLLIGVSGGIAAYKALEAARLAVLAGHAVRVIQTPASERFVGRQSFAAITGAPVLGDPFEPDPARGAFPGEPLPAHAPITHLALAAHADVYLIAPASADTLAKLALGAAENLLLAAALAAECPVVVAPAMNDRMYKNAATQASVRLLTERGITVVGPGEGELASLGEHGIGRMSEPRELLSVCEQLVRERPARERSAAEQPARERSAAEQLARKRSAAPGQAQGGPRLDGVRVLITAGGTREPIDSVRYIGNRSSGRMGLALATVAAARGAEVTLVAANVALAPPPAVRTLAVETAAQLARVCEQHFAEADVLVMAAAVADFRPASPVPYKLKKAAGQTPSAIELTPTADILEGLAAQRRPGQLLIGFAAQDGERALAHGREKLERKGLDAIVVNDISQPGIGFGAPDNEVVILTADGGSRRVPRAAKEQVAAAIFDELARLLEAARATRPGAALTTPGAPGAASGSLLSAPDAAATRSGGD